MNRIEMIKEWRKRKRRIKNNRRGNKLGFARCMSCSDSWYWKQHDRASIWFTEVNGMFPLCNECFDKLDEDRILAYCRALFMQWQLSGHDGNFADIKETLRQSIRERKKK